MDSESQYRLNEAKHNARLAELAKSPKLASLESEIGLCRLMIEEAINNGGARPLIRDLLSTAATLVKVYNTERRNADQLLEREALRVFAAKVVSVVIDEVADTHFDWESTIDRIANRLGEAVEQTSNAKPNVLENR